HNDLRNVGYTSRHHTFFEMLGNFSFGDYFKERAIPLAWEFLTSADYLGIDRNHLWITVFGGGKLFGEDAAAVPPDEDAFRLWMQTLQTAGFSESEARKRITRVSSADNFWMMGDSGPCGPCSEIFYDRDADAREFRGADETTADDCVEIWNLVFMEFNRDDSGALRELPAPCVDTGMGLERISAVMQKVRGNYDTDLFQNILRAADEEITNAGGESCGGKYTPSHRVVADHIRAAAYLIADGVLPDNEGRGYVLRKIIRRALIHGGKAGQKPQLGNNPWFCRLSAHLPGIMGRGAGKVLRDNAAKIESVLEREERGFSRNFLHGRAHLLKKLSDLGKTQGEEFPGDVAFELYDTYGFPVEATEDEAVARGFSGVNMAEFEECMNAQRGRSRAAAKFASGQNTAAYDGAATEFFGYEHLRGEAEIAAIFADGESVCEAKEGDEVLLVLNRTPFYAESGGQVGDIGIIKSENGTAAVRDTQKIRADARGHFAVITGGVLAAGDSVFCEVDAPRRLDIARNHSAAHLMHSALKRVLGNHVRQKGSLVAADHLRFDFSHDAPATDAQLREAERLVNEQIRLNHPAEIETLRYDEAIERGAIALFGEKYGDTVRMVAINPGFSVELCGGSHVARAGDIGLFQFTGESAIAAGVRRVEAVCGARAIDRAQQNAAYLKQIAAELKSPPEKTGEKIAQLRDSLKAAQKQIAVLRRTQTAAQTATLFAAAEEINGVKIVAAKLSGADSGTLREIASELRRAMPDGAILLAGDGGGAASFVAVSATDSVNAGQWLAAAARTASARGGGKPAYAQAGGGDPAKIEDALRTARNTIAQNAN
ncbi:MAG: alanine--tRNA ligase, partial [Gammaproteobacteria bacterium]